MGRAIHVLRSGTKEVYYRNSQESSDDANSRPPPMTQFGWVPPGLLHPFVSRAFTPHWKDDDDVLKPRILFFSFFLLVRI